MEHHNSAMAATNDRFKGIKHMVGNTPVLAIHYRYRGQKRVIFAKAEHMNLTGSIKDRMAFHILQKAYETGHIRPGDTIVEATSGNTGIAFAAIGRALGHPVIIYMPDWMSRERINLIESLGAKIVLVSKQDGGFLGSIEMTEELARTRTDMFLPRQFSNEANIRAHEESTGPELWWQMKFNNIAPRAFVAGVGTGGTVMGIGSFLRKTSPGTTVHPLQPVESPTLSTGHKVGHHRIQGISDEFIPAILDLKSLDPIVSVHDGDAILMAQKLASCLGIAVGISSGANVVGAMMLQVGLGDEEIVATVLPDDNKKYLSTDLLKTEPVTDAYLSPEVELLDYHAYKRVCHTCCDLNDCGQHLHV